MKMNIPDEYVPLIVKGLEHYYAYTRAVQRDDSRYQKAADWFQGEITAKSPVAAKSARTLRLPQPLGRTSSSAAAGGQDAQRQEFGAGGLRQRVAVGLVVFEHVPGDGDQLASGGHHGHVAIFLA